MLFFYQFLVTVDFVMGIQFNLVRLCLLAKDFGAHMISNSLSTVDDEIP